MILLFNLFKIGLLTFFAKVTGFIRDIIIAKTFGINQETDSLITSFKLPNFLRKIFAEGIFTYIFIPILSEYKEKKKKKINELISTTLVMLLIILIIVIGIGLIFTPQIIHIIFPGLINTQLTSKLTRIILPYTILISLTTFFTSISSIWNKFLSVAFTPVILNITTIVFSLIFKNKFNPPILSLAWALILGGILQLIIQIIYIRNIPIKISFKMINFNNKGIRKIINNIYNPLIGILIGLISQFTSLNIFSYLKSGSISCLYYADRLIELPLGVLELTLETILLPNLSKKYHKKDKKGYSELINSLIKITLIISIPSSIILLILSKPLIITLYQYGKFKIIDTITISNILNIYSLGLIGFILVKILTTGFYSLNKSKIPSQISILISIINPLINLLTIKKFKYLSIAITYSITSYLYAILLYWKLKKEKILVNKFSKFKKLLIIILISTLILSILIIFLKSKIIIISYKDIFIIRLIKLTSLIMIGTLTYICMLYKLGFNFKKI